MKLNYYFTLLICIGLFSVSCKTLKNTHEYTTYERNVVGREDVVPDAETARRIAKVILLKIYGDDIYNQEPLKPVLIKDSIWVITGSFPEYKPGGPLISGGVAHIEIQKKDCKVLKIFHGR